MIPRPVFELAVAKNLKSYSDIEVVLLKGHLIIHQLLYQLIAAHQVDVARVEKMNLMFGKTLELLMALNPDLLKNEYPHLREINRIRNKGAHELFFDDYHDDLRKWASVVLDHDPSIVRGKRTYKSDVINAFVKLAANINGMSDGMKHVLPPEQRP
jgi:hypothetical protein